MASDVSTQTELTPRQLDYINAFVRFTVREGYQPSLRQLGRELNLECASVNGVRNVMMILVAKGYMTFSPNKPRSYRLVMMPGGVGVCPLCGCRFHVGTGEHTNGPG